MPGLGGRWIMRSLGRGKIPPRTGRPVRPGGPDRGPGPLADAARYGNDLPGEVAGLDDHQQSLVAAWPPLIPPVSEGCRGVCARARVSSAAVGAARRAAGRTASTAMSRQARGSCWGPRPAGSACRCNPRHLDAGQVRFLVRGAGDSCAGAGRVTAAPGRGPGRAGPRRDITLAAGCGSKGCGAAESSCS